MVKSFLLLLAGFLAGAAVSAGEVEIVEAKAIATDRGEYRFVVTLRHDDDGWDHFADAWEVLANDGTVLARRTLRHPHNDEQPFTRTLNGVMIPLWISEVEIRAHDNQHGYSARSVRVKLY